MTGGEELLLAALVAEKKKTAAMRQQLRRAKKSRDLWKEKAMVGTPRRREYMREYMRANREEAA